MDYGVLFMDFSEDYGGDRGAVECNVGLLCDPQG